MKNLNRYHFLFIKNVSYNFLKLPLAENIRDIGTSDINKTINLQQYIDNRDGDKRIGLKCITYGVGWYNVIDEYLQKTGEGPHKIADGYYSFQQIADVFQGKNITLSVNETNGIASLITTDELKISKGLKLMLGFDNTLW